MFNDSAQQLMRRGIKRLPFEIMLKGNAWLSPQRESGTLSPVEPPSLSEKQLDEMETLEMESELEEEELNNLFASRQWVDSTRVRRFPLTVVCDPAPHSYFRTESECWG